jgi:signal peptidase
MVTALNIQPKRAIWITIVLLVGIYLAMNLGLANAISDSASAYLINPLLWIVIGVVIIFLPPYRTTARLKDKGSIIQLALVIGFFQMILFIIGGLFASFGKSPYAFTPMGILTNLFLVAGTLFGMEFSRAWLVNQLGRKHLFLALAFVAVVYTLLSVPLTQLTGLKLEVGSIDFINSTLLPSLAENLLATFLALLAGPIPALVYRGILQAFWWFSPVLPDLPWMFKGLIGTVLPIVGLVLMNRLYSPQTGPKKVKRTQGGSLTGWIITTVAAVAIIWFAVGLFPLQPALVASGSMEPKMYPGDVVIVAKMPADNIETGDIIQFRVREGVTIMHRVIEIQETEEGSKVFITKGDNNDEPDSEPVLPDNVVGKAIMTIPKVGWASIMVKQFFTGVS